jgi:hypothetical protein
VVARVKPADSALGGIWDAARQPCLNRRRHRAVHRIHTELWPEFGVFTVVASSK